MITDVEFNDVKFKMCIPPVNLHNSYHAGNVQSEIFHNKVWALDESNIITGVEVVVDSVITDGDGVEQEQLGINFLTQPGYMQKGYAFFTLSAVVFAKKYSIRLDACTVTIINAFLYVNIRCN